MRPKASVREPAPTQFESGERHQAATRNPERQLFRSADRRRQLQLSAVLKASHERQPLRQVLSPHQASLWKRCKGGKRGKEPPPSLLSATWNDLIWNNHQLHFFFVISFRRNIHSEIAFPFFFLQSLKKIPSQQPLFPVFRQQSCALLTLSPTSAGQQSQTRSRSHANIVFSPLLVKKICHPYLQKRIRIERKIRLRKQIQQYRVRSTSFQDQGARFSFYINRRRIEKRRIFPRGRRGGKNPAHQQNQTVAGRVCLNGDFRRLNMLESYSLSLPKFFFSPSFSFSVPLCGRDCRLPGCTEVCEITVLRSSSALPERRQSSGSLWHPHSPHTSANLVLIRPFFPVTLTA